MLCPTRGIVIHSVPYAEISLIVKIYTEQFGMTSFVIKGACGRSKGPRAALLQPMNLLDMMVYYRDKRNLQIPRELSVAHPYLKIPFDIRKEAILIFLNELIYRSVREEETNSSLFSFIWNSCLILDQSDSPYSSFHLVFTAGLMKFLGITPQIKGFRENSYLDLLEGVFTMHSANPEYTMDAHDSNNFHLLLTKQVEDHSSLKFSVSDRDHLLEALLRYYEIHLPGFHGMQSHRVLHTVLS